MAGRCSSAKLKLIRESISEIGLDLSGLTVLTELGSNDFMLMPIIAALGGAERVIAWTKDSRYGSADANEKAFYNFARNVEQCDRVEIRKNIRPAEDVAASHIITNSGMLRPIDADLLRSARVGQTVIPLMYDAWELREGEIDFNVCRERMICVCGVNESDPAFDVFSYVRPLAIKMSLNAGYEILGNTILVWSGDAFGEEVAAAFLAMGARKVVLTNDWVMARSVLPRADFVFITDYHETRSYLTDGGLFPPHEISSIAPHVGFVHLYGVIDVSATINAGHNIYPFSNGSAQVMTFTLADVGSLPVIRLISAGLKAGQEIIRGEALRFAQLINPV